ncbi:MAG: hypothetical protein ACI9DC_005490 [Gammaproteobacteria bacterium]
MPAQVDGNDWIATGESRRHQRGHADSPHAEHHERVAGLWLQGIHDRAGTFTVLRTVARVSALKEDCWKNDPATGRPSRLKAVLPSMRRPPSLSRATSLQ